MHACMHVLDPCICPVLTGCYTLDCSPCVCPCTNSGHRLREREKEREKRTGTHRRREGTCGADQFLGVENVSHAQGAEKGGSVGGSSSAKAGLFIAYEVLHGRKQGSSTQLFEVAAAVASGGGGEGVKVERVHGLVAQHRAEDVFALGAVGDVDQKRPGHASQNRLVDCPGSVRRPNHDDLPNTTSMVCVSM